MTHSNMGEVFHLKSLSLSLESTIIPRCTRVYNFNEVVQNLSHICTMANIFIGEWLTGCLASGHSFCVKLTGIFIFMSSSWDTKNKTGQTWGHTAGLTGWQDVTNKVTKPEVIHCFPEKTQTESQITQLWKWNCAWSDAAFQEMACDFSGSN